MPEPEHVADRSARAQARFLEYGATGRPDALAEVFDLCAPELLLVAHHLAAPGVPAEDLIQQTFLVAIQNAERFDGMRPLMPWLCGILVNVARAANRRSRRSDALAARPELDRDDPADVAQARELAAETLRAIDDLPARQREVLTLRLVHGLTPTEIAHALREPVGTVKSWIHRGVERLRTLLPAGFAAALAWLAGGDRGLAHAKDAVLAAATPRGTPFVEPRAEPEPATVRSESGTWVSTKATSGPAIAAAVALVVGGLWLATRFPLTTTSPDAGASPSVARIGDARSLAPPERREASSTVDSTPSPRVPDLVVRHADGAPAAIAFRLEPLYGIEPSFRDIEARTDAAGRASMAAVEPGPYRLVPDRGAPRSIDVRPGADPIAIVLDPGVRVDGLVRDAAGKPIAGARIWLSEHEEVTRGMTATITDDAGRFVLRDVPPRRNLAVLAAGFEAAPLRAVLQTDAQADAGAVTHEFVLERRREPFERLVLDANGQPARDACVLLGARVDARYRRVVPQHALYPAQTLRADEHGIVRADAPPPFPLRVWVRTPTSTALATSVDDTDSDHVLRLAAGARWNGDLAGAPATRVLVEARAAANERRSVDDIAPAFATPRAYLIGATRFELAGIEPGDVELTAYASDRSALRAATPRLGDVVAWSPRLEATRELRGLALDDGGTALAGYRVVVADDEGARAPIDVDDHGRFRVVVPEAGVLWLHGPKGIYPGTLTHRVLDDVSHDVVLRVARERLPSATLRVRVFAVDGTPSDRVCVVSAADATQIQGRREVDGWTTFALLPAGPYFVVVLDESGTRFVHGPIALARDEERIVDGLQIAPPGRVSVRLTDGDRRPLSGRLLLTTLDGAFVVTVFVAVDGVALSPPVPPGHYRLVTERSLGIPPLRVDIASDATTRVTPVVETLPQVTLRFTSPSLCGGLRLHVRWRRDGAPADGPVTGGDEWTEVLRIADGVAGEAAFSAVAHPGSYRVDVRSCEGLVGSARVDVTGDRQQPPIVIALHDGG